MKLIQAKPIRILIAVKKVAEEQKRGGGGRRGKGVGGERSEKRREPNKAEKLEVEINNLLFSGKVFENLS